MKNRRANHSRTSRKCSLLNEHIENHRKTSKIKSLKKKTRRNSKKNGTSRDSRFRPKKPDKLVHEKSHLNSAKMILRGRWRPSQATSKLVSNKSFNGKQTIDNRMQFKQKPQTNVNPTFAGLSKHSRQEYAWGGETPNGELQTRLRKGGRKRREREEAANGLKSVERTRKDLKGNQLKRANSRQMGRKNVVLKNADNRKMRPKIVSQREKRYKQKYLQSQSQTRKMLKTREKSKNRISNSKSSKKKETQKSKKLNRKPKINENVLGKKLKIAPETPLETYLYEEVESPKRGHLGSIRPGQISQTRANRQSGELKFMAKQKQKLNRPEQEKNSARNTRSVSENQIQNAFDRKIESSGPTEMSQSNVPFAGRPPLIFAFNNISSTVNYGPIQYSPNCESRGGRRRFCDFEMNGMFFGGNSTFHDLIGCKKQILVENNKINPSNFRQIDDFKRNKRKSRANGTSSKKQKKKSELGMLLMKKKKLKMEEGGAFSTGKKMANIQKNQSNQIFFRSFSNNANSDGESPKTS